ncbi:MAG: ribonuclease D, partial [Propionicimonas sp.]|nr:ribonuclease D [Propionicimonas sp.]
RWSRVRPALIARAEELTLPVENLVSPDVIRRLLWEAPAGMDAARLTEQLTQLGARPWQRELVTPVILAAWN